MRGGLLWKAQVLINDWFNVLSRSLWFFIHIQSVAAQTWTLPTIKATEQTAHWCLWRSHGAHSQDLFNFLTGWIAENSRGERGGKWNIKAYLEGDGGTEGLGLNQGRRGSQPTAVCLTDGRRVEGRERESGSEQPEEIKQIRSEALIQKPPFGPLAHPSCLFLHYLPLFPSPACWSRPSLSPSSITFLIYLHTHFVSYPPYHLHSFSSSPRLALPLWVYLHAQPEPGEMRLCRKLCNRFAHTCDISDFSLIYILISDWRLILKRGHSTDSTN